MKFERRAAYDNGPLNEKEFSVAFTQIGGSMCVPEDVQIPELKCQECGKDLSLLLQYVSQASTDDLHRVIYVLFCNNNDHYKKSLRVLTYIKKIVLPEYDSSAQDTPSTKSQQPTFDINGDTNLDDLLNDIANMGKQPLTVEPKKQQVQQNPAQEIKFILRNKALINARDVYSQSVESKIEDLLTGAAENSVVTVSPCFSELLAATLNGALYVIGYGRPQICRQRCLDKMLQGDFMDEIEGRRRPGQKQYEIQDDDDKDDNDQNIEQQINDIDEDDEEEKIDPAKIAAALDESPCKCKFCQDFLHKYVHELDIFGSVIWVTKTYEAENAAAFLSLYIFGANTDQPGLHDGYAIAQDDTDNGVDALCAELARR